MANLPGFTGSSGGITEQTFDMSAYAGDEISLAVRYITDASVVEPGVWLSSLSVGGVDVADATELSAWESLSQSHPTPIGGWTVQLVGWNDSEVSVVSLPVTAGNGWTADGDVSDLLGIDPTFAGAIVTVDDPSELITQYGRYQLSLDGVLQDGGRKASQAITAVGHVDSAWPTACLGAGQCADRHCVNGGRVPACFGGSLIWCRTFFADSGCASSAGHAKWLQVTHKAMWSGSSQ